MNGATAEPRAPFKAEETGSNLYDAVPPSGPELLATSWWVNQMISELSMHSLGLIALSFVGSLHRCGRVHNHMQNGV